MFKFLFSIALLTAPTVVTNRDAFLNAITQPGGTVDQALNYLKAQGIIPQTTV